VLAFFAVGHHLPGFMRAYGEKELFDRHKATFLISPLVVTAFVAWSVFSGHLGFFIFLALWDMWHFFMQHYGFMRIYDVKRRKPSLFSSRLDWWLTAIWFGYIVIDSPHYLINFLERCHRYGFGLYTWITPESLFALREWVFYLALGVAALYILNMARERARGVPVVWPKLAISLTTFATVFYAYVVLEDIILGYAITALAHDIQYFAIVWIYNHGVLKRSKELGSSFFRYLFADGRFRIVLFYVALILCYGAIEALARSTENYLIYDVAKVIIAASAFLHYYYDGFMWKVRKKEIRRNFVAERQQVGDDVMGKGWRESLEEGVARWVGLRYAFEMVRQVLYFGVPILFLAWSDATYSISDLEVGEYLVRMTPNVAKIHDDLGKTYVRQGQYDQAIAEHQKAVELDPEFAQAYTHLGIAYSLSGDLDQAVEFHRKAILLDPAMAQAHYNLGVDYWEGGKLIEAERAFKRSIEVDSQYTRAYRALSQVYKKQNDKIKFNEYVVRAHELEKAAQRREFGRSAMPWATGTALAKKPY
jgi:tetratricopeptide (TPR) repeat protein